MAAANQFFKFVNLPYVIIAKLILDISEGLLAGAGAAYGGGVGDAASRLLALENALC